MLPKLHKSIAFFTCRSALRLAQCPGSRWHRAPALRLGDCTYSLAVASSLKTSSAFAASTGLRTLSSGRIQSYATFNQPAGRRTAHASTTVHRTLELEKASSHVNWTCNTCWFSSWFCWICSWAVARQLPVEAHLLLYLSFYLHSFCVDPLAKSAPWNRKPFVKTTYLNLC